MEAPSKSRGPKNDINVTPLVDVVLVLLIIFMVITPMLSKGADVELPLTRKPEKAKSADEQVTISVTRDGTLYWEVEPKNDAEIIQLLADKHAKMPTVPIFVKGDTGASYGRVRQVMKMVQDAQFDHVGLITKEIDKGKGN